MIIEELTPENNREWDEFVDQHPASTCYHLRAWQTVAERAYHLRAPFLIVREQKGGPCQGILPCFQLRGLVQSHLTNGLFGAYGSILAKSGEARLSLVRAAQELCRKARLTFFILK